MILVFYMWLLRSFKCKKVNLVVAWVWMKFKMQDLLDIYLDNAEKLKKLKIIINKIF